nr:hypothetical protein [Tanacetum cinerariifolium]
AELEEEKRMAKQREENANIAKWDDVQAMIDVDYELAERIHEEEREELTVEEKSKLFVELKQKVDDDDKEIEDIKECFKIALKEEVDINAIPLAIKPAPIVGFKIHRKGRNGYYEIMTANGSAKTYLLFSQLLKEFDIEDLENLWKVVKARHGYKMLE